MNDSNSIFRFSKDETDQDAVEIRQKCEDYVLRINDLQSQILVVKTPIRRVSVNDPLSLSLSRLLL